MLKTILTNLAMDRPGVDISEEEDDEIRWVTGTLFGGKLSNQLILATSDMGKLQPAGSDTVNTIISSSGSWDANPICIDGVEYHDIYPGHDPPPYHTIKSASGARHCSRWRKATRAK
jgi:hypothetical protein